MRVDTHPASSTVQVWTYESSQGWVQHGASLIGTRDVSSWSYYDDGGYIGLRTIGGPSTYYDDFGGGSLPVAYQSVGGKVLAAYMPPPLRIRVKARPHLARIHKAVMLLTRPAGVIWRSYYYSGSTRIAMREDSDQGSEVYYILTDHLGSTSVAFTFDEYDQVDFISRQWYTPWGETRTGSSVTVTDYGFTGQLEDKAIGLYWYRSRWYDPALSRFAQADIIIPDALKPQAYDRFSYTNNNCIKFKDPSGHCIEGSEDYEECMLWADQIELDFTNINVITCIGDDTVNGCGGWTANEMELLFLVLTDFNFDISSASITFIRRNKEGYAAEKNKQKKENMR